VHYESSSDNITITHSAYNRSGFVTGALSAAEWVKDKKGVFTMKDFLNL
jgi:4-hydroxy-tetrahydrodipicolinate reductase